MDTQKPRYEEDFLKESLVPFYGLALTYHKCCCFWHVCNKAYVHWSMSSAVGVFIMSIVQLTQIDLHFGRAEGRCAYNWQQKPCLQNSQKYLKL